MFIRVHNGHKYRIYTANRDKTVIAVSSFAGKTVKGIAKCDPKDTPDLEKGITLAILRCDEKITAKKITRGKEKVETAAKELEFAQTKYEKAIQYLVDADKAHTNAYQELAYFQDSL